MSIPNHAHKAYNNFFRNSLEEQKRVGSALQQKRHNQEPYEMTHEPKQKPFTSQVDQRYCKPAITSTIKPQNIISGIKKIDLTKWKPTSASNSKTKTTDLIKNDYKSKFHQTLANGFFQIQRPITKQEQRIKGFSLKSGSFKAEPQSHRAQTDQHDLKFEQQLTSDQQMYHSQKIDLKERPQTSQGARKKRNAVVTPFHQQNDSILVYESSMTQVLTKQPENHHQPQKIIITKQPTNPPLVVHNVFSTYEDKKAKPIGTVFTKVEPKMAKKAGQFSKKGSVEIKRSKNQMNTALESSIGQEFLGLFAKRP